MKKRIISMVLVLILVLALASCDKHNHKYGNDWIIEKNATCTDTGRRYKECECGDKQYEVIPALGHNFIGGVCTICGASEK